jgi:hypothetical protein
MTYARTAVQDFSTSNKMYVNAIVTFHTVLNGEKTSDLATLYATLTGGALLANPQTLDSFGKFRQPVYIQDPVIATVTGLGNTPDHDTGVIDAGDIIRGAGSPEGVVTASVSTLYVRTDGGAGTTLYVKETGSGNTGWVAK